MQFELPTSAYMQEDLTRTVNQTIIDSPSIEMLEQLREGLLDLKARNLERLAKIKEQLAHSPHREDQWKAKAERVMRASGHLDQLIAQWLGQLKARLKKLRVGANANEYLDVEEAAKILSTWVRRFESLGVELPEEVMGAAYLIEKEVLP